MSPSARELERLKNLMDANLINSLGSNPGLAFRLGHTALIRGDWRAILWDRQKLLTITPQDVQRVAQKYFVRENVTVGYRLKKAKTPEKGGAR